MQRNQTKLTKVPFRGIFLFFIFIPFFLFAQPATEKPKLVVGIMIDGLQQEHINAFWNNFGTRSLRSIVEEGTVLNQVRYNIVSAGNASDVATFMTGTIPSYHGVAGNQYFNRKTKQEESILLDANQVGIGTSHRYSAHRLLSSTVLDELMLSNSGRSKSYVVGIEPEAAIMLGGHTANSVTWIDDVFIRWAATGYYAQGLSSSADRMNIDQSFYTISEAKWQPSLPVNTFLWNFGAGKAFEYKPSARKNADSPQTILRSTPAANTLVTDLAIKLIKEERLGKDMHPDMLMLQYTVRTPNERFSTVKSIEKEDMYLRLDADIKRLMERINWDVGFENTLIFVFSNISGVHTPIELGDNKIPAGYFNANRSIALLNTYLMAIYGQERWVEGYSGKNIFLNRRKIEEKKLNLREMQQVVADFMLEFEGVRATYTTAQVLMLPLSTDLDAVNIRNSYHKISGGDVVISLLSGWLEVDNQNNPIGETNSTNVETSVYFYGWKIPQQKINKPYHITDIAPTLSYILDIPFPNANIGKLVEELIP